MSSYFTDNFVTPCDPHTCIETNYEQLIGLREETTHTLIVANQFIPAFSRIYVKNADIVCSTNTTKLSKDKVEKSEPNIQTREIALVSLWIKEQQQQQEEEDEAKDEAKQEEHITFPYNLPQQSTENLEDVENKEDIDLWMQDMEYVAEHLQIDKTIVQACFQKLKPNMIHVCTPLSHHDMGTLLIMDKWISGLVHPHPHQTSANCCLHVDVINNWQVQLYTLKDIVEGESLSIDYLNPAATMCRTHENNVSSSSTTTTTTTTTDTTGMASHYTATTAQESWNYHQTLYRDRRDELEDKRVLWNQVQHTLPMLQQMAKHTQKQHDAIVTTEKNKKTFHRFLLFAMKRCSSWQEFMLAYCFFCMYGSSKVVKKIERISSFPQFIRQMFQLSFGNDKRPPMALLINCMMIEGITLCQYNKYWYRCSFQHAMGFE